MKRVIFIIFLMLFSCSTKKYTLRDAIKGLILNEKNMPINNVEIKFIENNNLFILMPVISNSKGEFFIEGIKTDN